MVNREYAKRFFELNIQYNRMLEQAGTHVIVNGEDAALYWLYTEDKPLFSGELSQRMELSSGRVANILNSLEKKGMIVRERNGARGVLSTAEPVKKPHKNEEDVV